MLALLLEEGLVQQVAARPHRAAEIRHPPAVQVVEHHYHVVGGFGQLILREVGGYPLDGQVSRDTPGRRERLRIGIHGPDQATAGRR